jgi:serine/threonine protein kinase
MKIGQGSFAAVHLALDTESRNRVAIKSYDMIGNEDNLRQKAIMNEITILRDIDHSNISKLYGVYEENGVWYVVL